MYDTIIGYAVSFITGAITYMVVSSRLEAAVQREVAARWGQELQAAHDRIRQERIGTSK